MKMNDQINLKADEPNACLNFLLCLDINDVITDLMLANVDYIVSIGAANKL